MQEYPKLWAGKVSFMAITLSCLSSPGMQLTPVDNPHLEFGRFDGVFGGRAQTKCGVRFICFMRRKGQVSAKVNIR